MKNVVLSLIGLVITIAVIVGAVDRGPRPAWAGDQEITIDLRDIIDDKGYPVIPVDEQDPYSYERRGCAIDTGWRRTGLQTKILSQTWCQTMSCTARICHGPNQTLCTDRTTVFNVACVRCGAGVNPNFDASSCSPV